MKKLKRNNMLSDKQKRLRLEMRNITELHAGTKYSPWKTIYKNYCEACGNIIHINNLVHKCDICYNTMTNKTIIAKPCYIFSYFQLGFQYWVDYDGNILENSKEYNYDMSD